MNQLRRNTGRGRREERLGAHVARLLRGSWREADPQAESAREVSLRAAALSPRAAALSEAELDEITPLLCASGAGALAWWRLRDTPLAATESGAVLHEVYRRFRLSGLIHEREVAHVFALLADAGIEAVLVKGWSIARRYPDRALRPYGDIDLCVRPDQYEKAAAALKCLESIEGHHTDLHCGFTRIGQTKPVQSPGSRVQGLSALTRLWTLDFGLGTNDKDDWDELFARSLLVQSPTSKVQSQSNAGTAGVPPAFMATSDGRGPKFNSQRNTKSGPGAVATGSNASTSDQTSDFGRWTLDSASDPVATAHGSDFIVPLRVPVRVLRDEDHLRILCLHLLRSGAWRPSWLCDVALLLESIQSSKHKAQSSEFDWAACLGRNPVHANWVGVVVRLAHELLGADIEQTPFADKQLPHWLAPAVLQQWGGKRTGLKAEGSGQKAVESPKSKVQGPSAANRLWTLDFGHWTGLYRRWDNPIRATAAVGGRFDDRSRLPYRLAELIARTPEAPEHLRSLLGRKRSTEAGEQRPENRGQRSEVGDQKAWNPRSETSESDFGLADL